ncbi:MAG: ABC transporter substrate-binding protein [Myxococcota bacterium]
MKFSHQLSPLSLRRRSLFAGLAASAIAMGTVERAAAADLTAFVKDHQDDFFKVIATPKTPARQSKLKGMFDQIFDYDTLARESLGKKWNDRSDAEKTQFTALLTDLVRENYNRNLTKMLDYNIRYVGEEPQGGRTLVKSRAKHKTKAREPEIEIDFLMEVQPGGPRVVDLYTERASLVKTYRSQFLRILRKKDFPTLISKLEKKLAKMKAG